MAFVVVSQGQGKEFSKIVARVPNMRQDLDIENWLPGGCFQCECASCPGFVRGNPHQSQFANAWESARSPGIVKFHKRPTASILHNLGCYMGISNVYLDKD